MICFVSSVCVFVCVYFLHSLLLQLKIRCFCSVEWLIVWCALLPICYLFDKIDKSHRAQCMHIHIHGFNCSNDNKGHAQWKYEAHLLCIQHKTCAHVTEIAHTWSKRTWIESMVSIVWIWALDEVRATKSEYSTQTNNELKTKMSTLTHK